MKKAILIFVSALLCAFILASCTPHENQKANTEDKYSEMQEEKALLDEIHSDQEHLYLFKVGTISLTKAYGEFFPSFSPINILHTTLAIHKNAHSNISAPHNFVLAKHFLGYKRIYEAIKYNTIYHET